MSFYFRQRETILDYDSVLAEYESARCQISPNYTQSGSTYDLQVNGNSNRRIRIEF